ncbi:MAG TPA: PaaI family thioesterase [Acidimicrobiales bacterium]|nr:PaaI family thioesterase [Acidimicrobiales bacterium]
MSENLIHRASTTPGVHEHLGVRVVEADKDRVVLAVEVGPTVHQPYGILHGGVSALLAEGAASMAGALNVAEDQIVVGTELNCSHLRPMTHGTLSATATPVRVGRSVQVWNIEMTDEHGRLISVARCSLQVLAAPPAR